MTASGNVETKRIVVTIDGPAGAGKSTVAKLLARDLGYGFLDTGAIYRTVALVAKNLGVGWGDEAQLAALAARLDIRFAVDGAVNRVFADGLDVTDSIRSPEISEGASQVSAHPAVRSALLGLQQRIGRPGGVVAEGRDVGTVVFPDARAKFFVNARAEVRADRRTREMALAGKTITREQVLRDQKTRDERDSSRSVAPLTKADDAVEIDTSDLSIEDVVLRMRSIIHEKLDRA